MILLAVIILLTLLILVLNDNQNRHMQSVKTPPRQKLEKHTDKEDEEALFTDASDLDI